MRMTPRARRSIGVHDSFMREEDDHRDQSRDTGMAMVLLLLLALFRGARNELLIAAIVVHVVNMTAPQLFRPVAVVWFGLSHAARHRRVEGAADASSSARRDADRRWCAGLIGKDSLQLRGFKAGNESVMVVRNHTSPPATSRSPY